MLKINPFTGQPELVNEGKATALYDSAGNIIVQVNDDSSVTLSEDLLLQGGFLVSNNLVSTLGCTFQFFPGASTSDPPTITLNGSDGSAGFAGNLITLNAIGGAAFSDIVSSGQTSFSDGGVTIGLATNLSWDGSASFANGTFTIDASGNLASSNGYMALGNGNGTNTIILDGSSDGSIQSVNWGIGNDGSASFAGDALIIGNDGTITGAFPGNDPHVTNQLYQDPVTHAVFVSQG